MAKETETKKEKKGAASYSEALLAFHAQMPAIKKDTENPFFNSKYADLKAIMDEARPIMVELGLVEEHIFEVNENGYQVIKTTITHMPSGESRTSTIIPMMQKNTLQELGSATTYIRRYALSAMLGIIVEDDDDDGHASSHTTKGEKAKASGAGPRPRPKAKVVKDESAFQYLIEDLNGAADLEEIKMIWEHVNEVKSEFPVGFLKTVTDVKNAVKERVENDGQ